MSFSVASSGILGRSQSNPGPSSSSATSEDEAEEEEEEEAPWGESRQSRMISFRFTLEF